MDPGTVEAITVTAFLFALVAVGRTVSAHLTQRKLLASHLSEEILREYIAWNRAAAREDALRWGSIWVGIGLALVLIDLLPVGFGDPIAYGLIFIFGGAGLLTYRAISGRNPQRPGAPADRRLS